MAFRAGTGFSLGTAMVPALSGFVVIIGAAGADPARFASPQSVRGSQRLDEKRLRS